MNRIRKMSGWLAGGIFVLLMFLSAMPSLAASPVNGNANSEQLHVGYTNVVEIPVTIVNGGKAKIEAIDFFPGKTPAEELPEAHGTKTIPAAENDILPEPTVISVADGATGLFRWEFPEDKVSDNTVYSYKITQVCDDSKKIYPEPDKTYYLDVYILFATPEGGTQDICYAIPILRYEDGSEAERKPEKCEFENIKRDLTPPRPKNAETWGRRGETQSSDRSSTGRILFEQGEGRFIRMQLIDPYTRQVTDRMTVDALDKNGNKIGTYTLSRFSLETGEATIIFQPYPDFVGDPQPCAVEVEDENGFIVTGYYQPHVVDETHPITPKTGDETKIWRFLLAGVSAAIVLAAIIAGRNVRRKRNEEEKK